MYNLAAMDKLLLVLERNKAPYSPLIAVEVNKSLNLDILRNSWVDVLENYPILQTVIKYQKKTAILEKAVIDVKKSFIILNSISTISDTDFYNKILNSTYDCTLDPLIYLIIYKKSENNVIIALKWLHSLFDGLSALKILEIVLNVYIAKIKNKIPILPNLKRFTIAEMVSESTHFHNGKKIPSKFRRNLIAARTLLSYTRNKFQKRYVGPFNKGEFDEGKFKYSSLIFPEEITNEFVRVKEKFGVTENDILVTIIFRSYLNMIESRCNSRMKFNLVMNIRPKTCDNYLGNLFVPIFVSVKPNSVKSDNLLLKEVKMQIDNHKKSIGPILMYNFVDNREISMNSAKDQAKSVFKIANVQFSNLGVLLYNINPEILEFFKVIDAEFCIGPKPGLHLVYSSIKINSLTKLGISYLSKVFKDDDIQLFLSMIIETAKDFVKEI